MAFKYFKKIKKNWDFLAICFLAAAFFLGASSYNYYTQSYGDPEKKELDYVKWASPDESANYVFTKLYAQEGRIAIEENYNLYAKDIMHPRSFRSDWGVMRPMSFLGIILIYGKIAAWIGYQVIPYLTPLFAAIGIAFYYLLVRRIFSRQIAFASAVMLAFFPPYVYFSARSMFHNVLFTSLLIISMYYSVLMARKASTPLPEGNFWEQLRAYWQEFFSWKFSASRWRGLLQAALAGLFMGAAAITRTSELLWLVPMLMFLWIFNLRRIGFIKLAVYLAFLFTALLPAMTSNKILYGSFYQGGYAEMNRSLGEMAAQSTELISTAARGDFSLAAQIANRIKEIIFYFGFQPQQSARMLIAYFVNMFPWLFWGAGLGFLVFATNFRKQKSRQWLFAGAVLIASAVLVLYYGSWEFFDNPDKTRFTIGNSYTRYWLPAYLGAMPFASLLLTRFFYGLSALGSKLLRRRDDSAQSAASGLFARRAGKSLFSSSMALAVLAVLSAYSLAFVLYGSEEGLIYFAQRQRDSRRQWQTVLSGTESNSVIITFYHDKLFFPERKVIVGDFSDPNMVRQYANLARLIPVYYYNFTFPQKDLEYLQTRRLPEYGLRMDTVKQVDQDFSLYRLELENRYEDK